LSLEPHISARLLIQGALLTHVTPSLRAVSLSVSADNRDLSLRFVFDSSATDDELELPSIVAAEVAAGWSDPHCVDEVVLTIPFPNKIDHLNWVVYCRCEDEWVEGRA
jgi:hypothetical protein